METFLKKKKKQKENINEIDTKNERKNRLKER